jgi:hypothetical protein
VVPVCTGTTSACLRPIHPGLAIVA